MSNFVCAFTPEFRESFEREYCSSPKNNVVRHAFYRSLISDAVHDGQAEAFTAPVYSVEVKTMKACNQKQSGRCWIFAALNVLREIVAKKMGVHDFELSQNYIAMFDKIEKANFAMESVISLLDRPASDRVFMHVLNEPVSDGGQWDMFVNLVKKYGLMPKSAFPETFQSEHTRQMDFLVNSRIRRFAFEAKKLHDSHLDDEIPSCKEKAVKDIYGLVLSCFGVPPKHFDFCYRTDKGEYVKDPNLTPLGFYEKYVGGFLDGCQSLVNAPTSDKPYGRNFTIAYLGNVVEGKRINHLNVPMERMKEAIIAQLKEGEPVWFGSDVGFYRDGGGSAWDDKAFDFESALGFVPEFDKAGMLDFRASMMNHAMVIVGVDLDENGRPIRWKIENSWGTENGNGGYYSMSASWFDKFVYQAVINVKYLSLEEIAATQQEPIVLDPWDPMGTLAD